MWKSFLRLAHVSTRLCRVGTLSQFSAIACCAFLSAPINAHNIAITGPADITQEGPKGTGAQDRTDAGNQDSMKLLVRLATEQVQANDRFLGRTRFSIDQQAHSFFYDLSAVPTSLVLSNQDRFAVPLEALIRVEVLRRDFGVAIPAEKFWPTSLDSIVQVVQRCVQHLESPPSERDPATTPQECSTSIEKQFDSLKTSILTYATAHGIEFAQRLQAREPAIGYRVIVEIDPPKARVRIMTRLEYKKYKYSQTPEEKYQWSDLLASENEMIGWYHYRAEWPANLNGPEEGDFEIKGPGTLRFMPISK